MSVIQGIYVALFGRPADPGGLAYWTEVTKNGQDLSEMLRVLPGLNEYTDRFAGQTPDQVITTIYQGLFGRAPDPAGLEFFKAQLASGAQNMATLAVNILQGAQGDDKADVDAKVDAAVLFTASLDTPEEIAAYSGNNAANAARAFLDAVDKDKPATPEDVNKAVGDVQSGQAPNPGGGGGGGTPTPPAASLNADGTVDIADGVTVSVTETNTTITIARAGFAPVTFAKANVTDLVIHEGGQVNIAASAAFSKFAGEGTLNVTGVSFQAAVKTGASNSLDAVPDLKALILRTHNDTDLTLSVNGSEADTIKALWDYWDAGYVANFPNSYTSLEINSATIELGLRYLDYLEDGGAALTDILAKGGGGREQTLHDNLLGNLTYASVNDRGFAPNIRDGFLNRIPDDIETRPWVSGNASDLGNAAHDQARAFDFKQGWAREDWIDTVRSGSVDPVAIDGNEMYYGDGNTVTGFNIVRHEGAGIEIALKAKQRGGADYAATVDSDGVAVYHVPAGSQAGNAARSVWSFDYAVATGLNGADSSLDAYSFKAFLDIDPSKLNDYIVLDMKNAADGPPFGNGFNPWILTNEPAGFGDDDGGKVNISQNSVNYGFAFIKDKIDGNPNQNGLQPYTYTDGEFKIVFQALDAAGNVVVENSILVVVGLGAPELL